jgi:hypothetical protein
MRTNIHVHAHARCIGARRSYEDCGLGSMTGPGNHRFLWSGRPQWAAQTPKIIVFRVRLTLPKPKSNLLTGSWERRALIQRQVHARMPPSHITCMCTCTGESEVPYLLFCVNINTSYFQELAPEIADFGGSAPPTAKPIGKGGGLRPLPFPVGFAVGG